MFKVGSNYEFHMIIDGDETTFWDTVESYEHPLLKLADTPAGSTSIVTGSGDLMGSFPAKTKPGMIINVTSPNFISAEEQTK